MPANSSQIATSTFPPFGEGIPDMIQANSHYEVGFALSENELCEIQRLRYEVFNLELNEGLDSSHAEGLDRDGFDAHCHHLFVRHRPSQQVIGTYRMQTGKMAESGEGFYSSTEFDFSALPADVLLDSVEIGRACIKIEHRSMKVLYLLWKGLGRYLAHNRKRYLFGCCSLTSQDDEEGAAVYSYLKSHGHLHADICIEPHESHSCLKSSVDSLREQRPPRLMRAYLTLGAKICSTPAIDRQFKTIDFLALFDTKSLRKSEMAFFRLIS